MLNNYIKQYINKITKDDIEKFSKKENVPLTKKELDNIYNFIKDNKNILLEKRYELLDKIKDKVEPTTYLKIKELFYIYENKYSSYL